MMTREFGQFIAGRPADWDAAAIHAAERAFADTIGCMIGGRADLAAQRARRTFEQWVDPHTGVQCINGGLLPAPWAALVNGAAAHALDYDDVSEPALTHPSAALVPALLALALSRGQSGARVIDAYIIGFEIQAALGAAMNDAHYGRGWHTTLTFGAVAVAGACARLLGLDAHAASAAVAAATSFSSGSKRQFGTNMKPIHAGLAAQSGIIAACMAEQGITAADEIFEGNWSFRSLFGGESAAGFDAARELLSGEPAITRLGIIHKAYPCCASTHRTIDAVRALRARGLTAHNLANLTTQVSGIVVGNLMYPEPADEMQARFSMNHCVALALVEDRIRVRDFYPDRLARHDLRKLWPLVHMQLDPRLPGKDVIAPMPEQARVVATLQDGTFMEEIAYFPKGHPRDPLGDDALASKFADCSEGALAPAAALDFFRRLSGLNAAEDLQFIAAQFAAISSD